MASKDLKALGRGHLGIGNGRFSGSDASLKIVSCIFIGWEKTFFEDSKHLLTLIAEVDGRDINLGIKYFLFDNFELLFAATELDNWILAHPAPFNTIRLSIGCAYFWEPH